MQRLAFLIALLSMALFLRAEPSPEKSTLTVAAASDLVYCLEELNREFTGRHPEVELKVSVGSSGNFFTQIQRGAPFDVFLSADVSYPAKLVQAGLAERESLTTYAVGRMVVWTTHANVNVGQGLAVVKNPGVRRFAIANPEHAPYGRAAKAALEKCGLWETASRKLVSADNIAQAAQFVQTGNADAGVVALSLVLSPTLAKVGRWSEIPADLHPRLEQAAVVTARAAGNPLAFAYIKFLRSSEARAIFDRYGFRLPEPSADATAVSLAKPAEEEVPAAR